MKLLSFPYLIQKEILDHLSIKNLLILSLCSKNTKNFIIRIQKNVLEKVEQVQYWINASVMWIDLQMESSQNRDMVLKLYENEVDFNREQHCDSVEDVRVDELGTYFFRCPTSHSNLHAKYCPATGESIIEKIHGQLYHLLGSHTKYWMSITGSLNTRTRFLPMIKNIQKMELAGDGLRSTKVDRFLSKSTCLEHFSLVTLRNNRCRLKKDSKLYELDTVYVLTDSPLSADLMERFNGRHVFFKDYQISTAGVIWFLNTWKLGEKFQKLEVFGIGASYPIGEIRNHIELKRLNRAVEYPFVRRFREPSFFQEYHRGKFETNLYMVRETDGHVTSVMLTPNLIMMGVWNMTEREFLAKFQ